MAHPHAQMIALPIVPSRQERRQDLAREHYRLHGKCLFCDYMHFEIREKVVCLFTGQMLFLSNDDETFGDVTHA